jgi:hypothetical protein
MAKVVYCAQCGLRIEVFRKALKGYGRIIDIIEPHECLEEPVELDLTPLEIPKTKATGEFVQNLDNLRPASVSTADLRDRRPTADVKSTAPIGVLDQIKANIPTKPANDIGGEPEGGD